MKPRGKISFKHLGMPDLAAHGPAFLRYCSDEQCLEFLGAGQVLLSDVFDQCLKRAVFTVEVNDGLLKFTVSGIDGEKVFAVKIEKGIDGGFYFF